MPVTTTQLDRRRDRSEAASAAVNTARARVTELEHRLQTNAEMTRQQTQALRNAEAEAKRLKRALKTQKRDRERLLKAKTKADAKAKKAERKAATAEDKYDKSVLADMVHREKERDRAAAKGNQSRPVAALPGAVSDGSAGSHGSAVSDGPASEPPETATARETAARATADKAG